MTIPPLEELVQTYGYLAILVGTFFEGEAIVILGGFLAHRGYLEIEGVIVIAFVGTCLGDSLYYWIGRRYGTRAMDWRPSLKRRLNRPFRLLERYDALFILSFRFIYGARSVSAIAIGMAGVRPLRFVSLNIVAAGIWAIAVGLGGYLFGAMLQTILGRIEQYDFWILGGMALMALAVWLLHVVRLRRRAARCRLPTTTAAMDVKAELDAGDR